MAIITAPEAFGHYTTDVDRNPAIDFGFYTGNRFDVFNKTEISFCIFGNGNDDYNRIGVQSVVDWHGNLTKITGNTKVWNMITYVEPQDTSICDGIIDFQKIPSSNLISLYGAVGFSNPAGHVSNVTIYTDFYQEALRNITDEQWESMSMEEFENIIQNWTHPTHDLEMIHRVTLHELGHAFGLNHPDFIYTTPSIMNYDQSHTRITEDDVWKIVEIYPNGFAIPLESKSFELNQASNSIQTFWTGQYSTIKIEVPFKYNEVQTRGASIYLHIDGKKVGSDVINSDVKIHKRQGMDSIYDPQNYFEFISAIPVHFENDKFQLHFQFIANKEMPPVDMYIVTQKISGQETQYEIKDAFQIKKSIFDKQLENRMEREYSLNLKSISTV